MVGREDFMSRSDSVLWEDPAAAPEERVVVKEERLEPRETWRGRQWSSGESAEMSTKAEL